MAGVVSADSLVCRAARVAARVTNRRRDDALLVTELRLHSPESSGREAGDLGLAGGPLSSLHRIEPRRGARRRAGSRHETHRFSLRAKCNYTENIYRKRPTNGGCSNTRQAGFQIFVLSLRFAQIRRNVLGLPAGEKFPITPGPHLNNLRFTGRTQYPSP